MIEIEPKSLWNKWDRRAYDKAYKEKHKEHLKAYNKEYRLKNQEHIKNVQKKWCLKNKEKLKIWQKEYWRKNKEKICAYKKEYFLKKLKIDPEFYRKRNLLYREYRRNYYRNYYRKNKKVILGDITSPKMQDIHAKRCNF